MISKNISIEIKDNETVPLKETYIIFYKDNKKVKIVQKFIDKSKNQTITLNFEECKRLANLFHFYVFKGKREYVKDKILVFKSKLTD